MTDEDFNALLAEFLSAPPRDLNPGFTDVVIEIGPTVAAKLRAKHRISPRDIEDAVKGQSPPVELATHADPMLCRFFGFTRTGRGIFGVGAWRGRTLRIITAFEPDDGEQYWKRHRR